MIFLKGILALTILFVIPLLLGFLFLKFLKEEKNNIFLGFVLGYLTEFAICQLIAVPMIFLQFTFTTLLYTYLGILLVLSIISVILNRKRVKEIASESVKNIKCFPIVLSIITIVLIAVQIYAFVGYAHVDDDDAFYVGTSTVAVQTDTLYKYSPTTGEEEYGDHLSLRYRLAPFPLFTAIVSKIINIHPAIVAHLIIPIVFVPIVYMIYGLIANELLKGNKENILLFLIVLSVLHIWGNYSIRNNYTFLLFRIWQGKSVLANMIIPAVILFFIKAEKSEYSFVSVLLIMITLLAGTFTTTMGVGLPPIVLIILCVVYEMLKINYKELKNNNYKLHITNVLKSLVCCIPSVIYAVIYFMYWNVR